MDKYTNLENTASYLSKLKDWIGEPDGNLPDLRNFPPNIKDHKVLILREDSFYIPKEGTNAWFPNYVAKNVISGLEHLVGTVGEVTGDSEIAYYNPWDKDVKVKLIDGSEKYLDSWGPTNHFDTKESFAFIPHPEKFGEFKELLPYLTKTPQIIINKLEEHYQGAKP